jgi:hypothetical protein
VKKTISLANLVLLGGSAITLLFSLFKFAGVGPFKYSAWSTDGLAFVSTIPAILALVTIVWTVLELAGVKLPAHVLSFTGTQLKATWAISSVGIMVAFLTTDFDKKFGFWMMLLGTIAMTAGAVLNLLGKGTDEVDLGQLAQRATNQAPSASAPPPPPPAAGGATPPPPPPPPPAG